MSGVEVDSSRGDLLDVVQKMSGVRLAIIGDVGLDEYVNGDVRRISPEAPVPVLEAKEESLCLGLSGNVAQNVKSLGGDPVFISVAGEDEASQQICSLLEEKGVSASGIIRDSSRPTTRKLRVLTGHHHIVRVDFEQRSFLSKEVEERVLSRLQENLSSCAGVILQDYSKGVLSQELVKAVIDMARKDKKPVLVDPHRSTPVEFYRGANLFKPNFDEAVVLSGYPIGSIARKEDAVSEIAKSLFSKGSFDNLVITRGPQGMSLFEDGGRVDIPTKARQVFDVTGAGDTVIAALGLAWSSGASLVHACEIANFAARVVVSKVGCVPCSVDQLRHSISTET